LSKQITGKVTWVGKVDWELKSFHGDELSTWKGSSYNSYLVRDQKTVLIDTVWGPYDREFVARLKKEVDLDKIDYVIANHSESDHSGALPALMREIPDTPIYCTANGVKVLKGQYHQDWNFVTVKTGDTLDIGDSKLVFVEAPMLHWPDTMFTYMTGENILFSNDAFGQHYASESLYNDKVDQNEVFYEALKYYANILAPFSPMVGRKIQELLGLSLPINVICPSHGIIWRDNPMRIVEQYQKWAANYQENQITVVYDTMWNSTRKMAEAIAAGISAEDPDVTIKIMNAAKDDKNDIITEIFRSKTVVVGSPTVNNRILHSIAGLLEMVRALKFKGKSGAAFGSYGWSGESAGIISKSLEESGFALLDAGLKVQWAPDDDAVAKCVEFGRKIAAAK
jgi:anaerobic nitric oxide reductase flavorubredoxin